MISLHVAHLAWYAALMVLGALLSAPFWMGYALMKDQERREWDARRREQGDRRGR